MRYFIHGVVQGVGFRPRVYNIATKLGLSGYVCNHGSNVEVFIHGSVEGAGSFIRELRENPPPLARIIRVDEAPDPESVSEYSSGFTILESRSGSRDSRLPPDVATCDPCLEEMDDPGNRRHDYPFTNCTDCGARYTAISGLPYDRPLTSMAPFGMCAECEKDYRDPGNRRFHAQTTSCPACGPRYRLHGRDGREVPGGDPFGSFARRIAEGEVGVFKGWGGMHIISTFGGVGRLRELYGRPNKPFAVMFRDMESARAYVHVDEEAKRLMCGIERPIVILAGKDGTDGNGPMEDISPGLGSIGCLLPYTAAQKVFFDRLRSVPGGSDVPGVVFTSANLPGEPMLTGNGDALGLGLDCYLLHDRDIVQRCDDSLVKLHRGRRLFIRRSRGFVPLPLEAGHDRTVLAFGAERNVSVTLAHRGTMYTSQYIGNTNYLETLGFMESAGRHLMDLFGVGRPEFLATDLHPQYPSRRSVAALAEEFGCPVLEFQHHHAHGASLHVESLQDERTGGTEDAGEEAGPRVFITVDGAGYGEDGNVWGGEVLLCDGDGYRREAHLENIPLPGGDMAVRDPYRLLHGLYSATGLESGLYTGAAARMLENALVRSPRTSSMGRLLDAVSCHLGIGTARTYEGEPAMRLEPWLGRGDAKVTTQPETYDEGGVRVIRTLPLLEDLFRKAPLEVRVPVSSLDVSGRLPVPGVRTDSLAPGRKADLAGRIIRSVTEALADAACDAAEAEGCPEVGLSGGVAYCLPVADWVEGRVRARGLSYRGHTSIPPGDGGISTGQAYLAGLHPDPS